MCEEVRNPSLIVPRSIMGSITINGLLGFGMIIAMLYSATDIDAAIETPTGYPFMEIFYQATGSINGTAGMTALIIVMTLSATVGVIASTSRMLWAFSRDNAMPFSQTLAKVCLVINYSSELKLTISRSSPELTCLCGPSPSLASFPASSV